MFGPRITTVFRNRWRALWWAASILIGVYYFIPRQGDGASEDVKAAVEMIGGDPADHRSDKHANPWAKESPQP